VYAVYEYDRPPNNDPRWLSIEYHHFSLLFGDFESRVSLSFGILSVTSSFKTAITTMMRYSSLLLSFLFAAVVTPATSADITADSTLGQSLISQATRHLEDGDDYSFVGDYAIKFQGCHHVQQWNADVDEDSDVRIKTKRLARFRLCPSDTCSDTKSAGCTSKYGDYVVDMNTFVYYYLAGIEEEKEALCEATATDCDTMCGEDNDDCMGECYTGYDATFCLDEEDEDGNEQFDAQEYAACAQIDLNNGGRRKLEGNNGNDDGNYQYYIGPYCADQGGEIHLGLFSDDTCTTYVSGGEDMFYSIMGYALPYSDDSLITTRCFDCMSAADENDGGYETKETCSGLYKVAGKCETKMSGNDYPNESSCGYIAGIKIIREDGVIRTSTTRKSKTAAVAIGLFMTLSVLLAGYVYYLRTKLGRAQVNLSASAATLT
jgi:hypothetical protein